MGDIIEKIILVGIVVGLIYLAVTEWMIFVWIVVIVVLLVFCVVMVAMSSSDD